MSETGNSDKTVGAPPKATLHLKRPVEQGTVRQSFSHGRSKAVVVEKVKRRILTPAEAAAGRATGAAAPPPPRRRRAQLAEPILAGTRRRPCRACETHSSARRPRPASSCRPCRPSSAKRARGR